MSTGKVQSAKTSAMGIGNSAFDEISIHRELSPLVLSAIRSLESEQVCTPFQLPRWLTQMSATVGGVNEQDVLVIMLSKNGKPVLILPFALDRSGKLSRLTWLSQNLADYAGPIGTLAALNKLDEITIAKILRFTAQNVGGIDLVVLEKQKRTYAGHPNPFVNESSILYHVAAHATALRSDWLEYYAAKRSSRTRSRLNSKLKALAKLGNLEIRFSTEPGEAELLVRRALDMKARQLNIKGHSNPFAAGTVMDRLVSTFSGRCNHGTWVASLSLDGNPIAISFGFKSAESWLLYQIAMEPGAYTTHSPGTQLINFLLAHCCAQGVKTFDFSLGDEEYKKDWCEVTEHLYSTFLPITARGQAAAAGLRLAAHGRLLTASNPWIYERAKILKGRFNKKVSSPAADSGRSTTVQFLTANELPAIAQAWRNLSDNAVEDNAYYAPHYTKALLASVADKEQIKFITAWSGPDLIGFLPVQKVFGQWRAWQTDYNYSSTPLLNANNPQQAAEGIIEGLSRLHLGQWHIPTVNCEGPAASAFCAALARRGNPFNFANQFERAFLTKQGNLDTHMTSYLSKDLRKDLNRRRRRLEEIGRLTHVHYDHGQLLKESVAEFLKLEAGGWKGKRGTALGNSRSGLAYAELAFNSAEPGQVRLDMLRLDDQAIAAVLTVFSGNTGYTVKSAYDEGFAKFSPAKLLELAILESFYAGNWARWLDSGTNGAHVIDEFWPGRTKVASLAFSLSRHGAGAGLYLMTARMRAVAGLKSSIKRLLKRA